MYIEKENLEINANLEEILDELFLELHINGSNLFSRGYKQQNEYLSVQCPFHKFGLEKHPSAQFRKSDGLFYCFGCKEVRSLPDLISELLSINGRSWILSKFDSDDIKKRSVNLKILNKKKKQQNYIPKEILANFRYTHPYMFKRKLNLDTIRRFDIGYDIDTNCITFPNKDENGNILFIASRSVVSKFFTYPAEVDKPIYGLFEIYREMNHGVEINEVYVCESMLDALYIWSLGKYAVALNGTGSSYQYELLKKSKIRQFILAFDNDKYGKIAREKFKENINNKIIKDLSYKSYGNCKDINDMTEEQFLNAEIEFKLI